MTDTATTAAVTRDQFDGYLAGQRMMLAEVETVAVQLGPLSAQRLRAWVISRREQLRQETGS